MSTDELTDQQRRLVASIHKMGCENKRLKQRVAELEDEVESLRKIVAMVHEWGFNYHGFRQQSDGTNGSPRDNLLACICKEMTAAEAAEGGE